HAGKILLRQRPPTGLLAGMWELPDRSAKGKLLVSVRHTITHRRITLNVFAGKFTGKLRTNERWIAGQQLRHITMPAGQRRALTAAIESAHRSGVAVAHRCR